MTDMTHDDGNSLIRYLYYAPYFDTEAIVITQQLPDFSHKQDGPWQKGQSILNAYREEHPQLAKHDPNFPTYDYLQSVTKKGRGALPIIWLTNEKKFDGEIAGRYVGSTWGDIQFDDWIGEGVNPNGEPKDSEGSEYLQQVFDKPDDRPIFVQMWGGPVAFVQALYRYKQRQGAAKFEKLLGKLHVFGILLQDITFDYLIDLDQVKATKCVDIRTTQSTYEGKREKVGWLLHDTGHFWEYIKVMKQSEVNGNGPMSALYDHGGEGDTPAFLYLLSAKLGLNDPLDPAQGSWGSRFVPMGEAFPQGYYHTCQVNKTELSRWIPEVKNSFLNRLQYSRKNPEEVNHEPIVALNGDRSREVLSLKDKPGQEIELRTEGTYDPDRDTLTYRWFYYKEASDYLGDFPISPSPAANHTFRIPIDLGDKKIHLVLEVKDSGTPSLVAYRRVVLSVK